MNRPWWKEAVIYQIYPRSFQDSNNDGTGDLKGIVSRLDYLKELGVNAIWLSPFFKSPMKDFGYDVSDYEDVDPIFGSIEDFDLLLNEAHKRNLRVVIDQVLNHTSDQHPWFVESKSSKDNPKADWYIWVDGEKGTPPNNWMSYFGGSAWKWDETRKQYYLHLFVKEQPDLNWRNLEVVEAVMNSMKFWLDKGVDGLRLDAVNLFFKDKRLRDNPFIKNSNSLIEFENQHLIFTRDRPETLLAMEDIRNLVDNYGDILTVGEVSTGVEQFYEYTKPGRLNLAFNFDFMNVAEFKADAFSDSIERCEGFFRDLSWPSYVLGNHDTNRLLNRFGDGKHDSEIAKLLAAMLLTVRGTPFIYYGEELGMTEGDIPFEKIVDPVGKAFWPEHKGRDGCRTPMQWDSSELAGFSEVEPWLPVNPNKSKLSVEKEEQDPLSILNFYKKILELRKNSPALRLGDYERIELDCKNVLAYVRNYESDRKLVILNFNSSATNIELPEKYAGKASTIFGTGRAFEVKLEKRIPLLPFEVIISELPALNDTTEVVKANLIESEA